jgi:hypothetical protein
MTDATRTALLLSILRSVEAAMQLLMEPQQPAEQTGQTGKRLPPVMGGGSHTGPEQGK